MEVDFVKTLIEDIRTRDDLKNIVEILRPIAVNNKSDQVLSLVSEALEKSKYIDDTKLTIFLHDLQIRQIYHLNDQLEQVYYLLSEMKILTKESKDESCNALVKQLTWHIEKFKGNKNRSSLAINEAMKLVNRNVVEDSYTYYFVKYSYAIEEWLGYHNPDSATLLEDCVPYFFEKRMHRSLAQTLGVLSIIYQRTNNHKKAAKTAEKILINRDLMDKISLDIKSIVYYLAGVGEILQSNLKNAEVFFTESLMILENIQDTSLYYDYYYIRNIAHIATIQALTGYWDLAFRSINKIENLLQDDDITSNFDRHSVKQIPHTFNLIKFYIYSRMQDFETSKHKELIDSIYMNLEKQYSNPILLIEYIINADLKNERLEKLSKSDFENLKRVKHIISYKITKKKIGSSNQPGELSKSCIQTLESSTKGEKETYLEKAYTNLLIAKELFANEKYDKIHLLMRKYVNRLDKLEVLEFRVFMEAFIQVGAYKSGDPLGPALQYMAIKKCRQYGFSRLENKLLDYLNIQGIDALRMMV